MTFSFPIAPKLKLLLPIVWIACAATLQSSATERDEQPLPIDGTPASELHDAMVDDLKFLSSDELQGRSSIDATILDAADYIAARFQSLGLQTDLFDGTALQFLDISVGPQIGSGDANFFQTESRDAAAEARGNSRDWELARDFTPLAIGASEGETSGDLVFVGYGIRAPEHDYDDYEEVDPEGKIVIMLRKEPGAKDPASPFDGLENTRHAYFETKVATAIDAGAAAVLLVNDAASVENMVAEARKRRQGELSRIAKIRKRVLELPAEAVHAREKLNRQIARIEAMLEESDAESAAARGLLGIVEAGTQSKRGDERRAETSEDADATRPPIPVLSISRDLADHLLADELSSIEAAIDSDWQPRSRELAGKRGLLGVGLTPSTVRSPNVIGVLPGRGELADETIVIGAHFDHVGMGEFGSLAPGTVAVHNGADDNASGTAAMLRVAGDLVSKFSRAGGPTSHRRIVFIAFTGEERGLLGSKHYIKQPRFPLSSTVAMINMDMVGRLTDNDLTVYGTGSAAGFESMLNDLNREADFRLTQVSSGYGPSDHSSFYQAGVPVLFFFTGLHTDYHRPSDDFDKLNLIGMDRITDMVSQVSERLATVPERPVYAETEKNVQIRRQLTVSMGVTLSQQPGEVVLSSIAAAGPAEQGGLRSGDRLIRVGKKEIHEIGDVMDQLRRRSPGDVLSVSVRRDAEEHSFDVELESR
ncbi:M28 family peptidase [Allorhodopirellula solitaria]|nr:M28 family peptidase [Allorhodopirellula solitaria]